MRKIAISIGINNYPFRHLNHCVNDAKDIASILSDPSYGFDVYEIINEEATRARIKRLITQAASSKPDFLLVYFAGHGLITGSGGCICTIDGEEFDEGVYFDNLVSMLAPLDGESNIVLILDCCRSGSAEISNNVSAQQHLTPDTVKNSFQGFGKGRIVIAACEQHDTAKELSSIQHGIFTYHLLNALNGYAADSNGDINILRVYDHISKELKKSNLQKPVLKGDIIGTIILGSGFEPITHEPLDQDALGDISSKAENLIEQYDEVISKLVYSKSWKEKGYLCACHSLEPTANWFVDKLKKFPDLKNNIKFKTSFESLNHRLSQLTRLDSGTAIQLGKIDNVIGSGTFGTVYKVSDPNNNLFAYKVLHAHDLLNTEKVQRFKRGYEAMLQLDHPHIVKVNHLTNCPLGFYMQYVDGPNFRDFSGTQLDTESLISILLTIADTLKHTHKRNVIHRDVKPENIILKYENDQWRPYLTDFDLAWHSTATKITNEALGTLFYAAPEQLSKPRSPISTKNTVDVYSFGQVCFFAACNSDPSPADPEGNRRTLSSRMKNYWPTEQAASLFTELYYECSQIDPKNRPQSFDSIASQLHHLLNLVRGTDRDEVLDVSRFIKELLYSIVGLSPEKIFGEADFDSPSGQVMISLKANHINEETIKLSINISSKGPLVKEGISWDKLRKTLNRRVDEAIKPFIHTTRTSVFSNSFEVLINTIRKPTLTSVEEVKLIITNCIDAIETS